MPYQSFPGYRTPSLSFEDALQVPFQIQGQGLEWSAF